MKLLLQKSFFYKSLKINLLFFNFNASFFQRIKIVRLLSSSLTSMVENPFLCLFQFYPVCFYNNFILIYLLGLVLISSIRESISVVSRLIRL